MATIFTSDRDGEHGWTRRVADAWLRWRMRSAIRLRAGRYSLPAALNQALRTGLPVAAIITATVPVWGMNWYFDTENWAAGVWNSWAESRTDPWREAMVRAVLASEGARAARLPFAVEPGGVDGGDFSFVVIGDPGEGDASQHVLRDQLLTVAASADVRFVVVSSDVVYPSGSMIDYEAKFWLPFKGITRPVYAIPGNHDWYDALEAFAATFLQSEAARASIRARVEADLRVTSTTDARIEHPSMRPDACACVRGPDRISTRAVLRDPDGPVRARRNRHRRPALDRSGAGRVARGALQRSAGKFTMAVLGHPFFAAGNDATWAGGPFARLKQLLLSHGVTILMAGDTHDLEHYVPAGQLPPTPRTTSSMAAVAHFLAWAPRRLAGAATDCRLGVLPDPRAWRARLTQELPGGSGRPGGGRSISMRGRSAPAGSPPRSTTTSRRFFRASSRSRWNHPRIACESSRTGCMGA